MDLIEHVFEVVLRAHPRRYGVAEEDEITHDSVWVHVDHYADPAERRILLFVVTDVTQ